MSQNQVAHLASYSDELHKDLERFHGPVLGGASLMAALGYSNAAAFRQARKQGRVDVPLFTLPRRRGFFALTRDVAAWLAAARLCADRQSSHQPEKGAKS